MYATIISWVQVDLWSTEVLSAWWEIPVSLVSEQLLFLKLQKSHFTTISQFRGSRGPKVKFYQSELTASDSEFVLHWMYDQNEASGYLKKSKPKSNHFVLERGNIWGTKTKCSWDITFTKMAPMEWRHENNLVCLFFLMFRTMEIATFTTTAFFSCLSTTSHQSWSGRPTGSELGHF